MEKNGKYGYIDASGKNVIPCEWDYAFDFSEGLAQVGKDGKYGYINASGKNVIPCEWDFVFNFFEGLAMVFEEDKDGNVKGGFIDTNGKIVIPCEYDSLAFNGDRFFLIKDRYLTILDRDGNRIY